MNNTTEPNNQFFEAFGVNFGIFSTYDIFLKNIANDKKTDFIFTSSWKNYMPFLSGIICFIKYVLVSDLIMLDQQNNYGEAYIKIKKALN